jgi:G3E family GTPase
MGDALLELKGIPFHSIISLIEKYNPARIIVETSGSAFPAPIAVQIRQLSRENRGVHLDSIITVIDCVNFRGYDVVPLHASMLTNRILLIPPSYKLDTPMSYL